MGSKGKITAATSGEMVAIRRGLVRRYMRSGRLPSPAAVTIAAPAPRPARAGPKRAGEPSKKGPAKPPPPSKRKAARPKTPVPVEAPSTEPAPQPLESAPLEGTEPLESTSV